MHEIDRRALSTLPRAAKHCAGKYGAWVRRIAVPQRIAASNPLGITPSGWLRVTELNSSRITAAGSSRITAFDWFGITPSDLSGFTKSTSLVIATFFLLGFTASCSWLPFAPRSIPDCPGAIRSTDDIRGDFTIRERVTVRAEGVDFPFELIVQKKQRELILVGLSPLGAKLFSLVQTGIEIDLDALPGAVLPIPPLNVLRDLHRFRFSHPDTPSSEPEPAVFDHTECGYSIRFETLSEGPLQ